MGHPGLEPGTNRLKAEYSTIELVTLAGMRLAHRLLSYHKTLKLSQLISVIIIVAD
jgi:hypothetical protein